LHSAKALPSAALGKEPSVKFWSAKVSLPSVFYRALGKGFAECKLASTRQRKVVVTAPAPVTAALPSTSLADTRQIFFYFFLKFFAECRRVWHSAKKLIFLK
jgi:hypothetical protein